MKPKRKPTTTAIREQWRLEQDCCMMPGCKARFGLQVHEIVGSSDRHKAIHLTAMFLCLCPQHHEQLGSRPNQKSLVRQLAVKQWADPENSDPAAVIRMWRPKCTQEFLSEILNAVAEEYKIIHFFARKWT